MNIIKLTANKNISNIIRYNNLKNWATSYKIINIIPFYVLKNIEAIIIYHWKDGNKKCQLLVFLQ